MPFLWRQLLFVFFFESAIVLGTGGHQRRGLVIQPDLKPGEGASQKPFVDGLLIGTFRSLGDCVKNGTIADHWRFGQHSKLSRIAAGQTSNSFFLGLAVKIVGLRTTQELGEASVRSAQGDILQARLTGDGSRPGKINAVSFAEIRVEYDCQQAGESEVLLTIPFGNGVRPIVMSWVKVCADQNMKGLVLKMMQGPQPDVFFTGEKAKGHNEDLVAVADGKATAKWAPDTAHDACDGPAHRDTPAVILRGLEASFEISRNAESSASQYVLRPPSVSADPPILLTTSLVSAEGDDGPRRWIDARDPEAVTLFDPVKRGLRLRVHLECLEDGPKQSHVVVQLTPEHPNNPFAAVTFGWWHCCGVPHPQLLISSLPQVLTRSRVLVADADVATGGALLQSWDSPSDARMTVDSYQDTVRFFYALAPDTSLSEESRSQQMRWPRVAVVPAAVAECRAIGKMAAAGDAATEEEKAPLNGLDAVSSAWRSLVVHCECRAAAAASAVVTVDVRPAGYAPVKLRILKLCGGPKFGAHVRILSSQIHIEGGDSHSSEKMPPWVDVVRNGATMPLWQRHDNANASADATGGEHQPPRVLLEPNDAFGGTTFTVVLGAARAPEPDWYGTETEADGGERFRRTSAVAAAAAAAARVAEDRQRQRQRIGRVLVRTSDPDLTVKISGSLVNSSNVTMLWSNDTGTSLALAQAYGLHAHYKCRESAGWFPKATGSAKHGKNIRVTVSIPMLDPLFAPLEFSWYYHCRGWMQQASYALWDHWFD